MAEVDNTELKVIPAPVGGWNTRDPLHAMPENQAMEFTNWWPENANVVNRGGSSYWAEAPDAAYDRTLELFALPSATSGSNANYLFQLAYDAFGAAYKLYRINTSTKAYTDITPGGVVWGSYYSKFVFRNRVFAFRAGADPIYMDAAGAGAVVWSGTGLTITNLVQGTSYKGRVYIVERNSSNVWYGGITAVTGPLTQFSVLGALTRGGTVTAVGSVTQEGDAASNLFMIVSSVGEVLLFEGDYPGSSTWQLRGRYFIGEPLGHDCIVYIGGDAHIMCADGIVPVSNLIGNVRNGTKYAAITDAIGPTWRATVNTWRANSTLYSFFWRAVVSHYHNMLFIRAADSLVGGTTYFAQNIETQAWTKITGIAADRMTVLNENVFFGATFSAVAGASIAYLEQHGAGVNTDYNISTGATNPFTMYFRQAFNYLGDPSLEKHITSVKAFFELTQEAGHSVATRELDLGADTDFANQNDYNQVILRDIATNETYTYVLPTDIRADGTAFSLLCRARFGGGYKIKVNMFIANYEPGGFLT